MTETFRSSVTKSVTKSVNKSVTKRMRFARRDPSLVLGISMGHVVICDTYTPPSFSLLRIEPTNGHFYLCGVWHRKHTFLGTGEEEGCAARTGERLGGRVGGGR